MAKKVPAERDGHFIRTYAANLLAGMGIQNKGGCLREACDFAATVNSELNSTAAESPVPAAGRLFVLLLVAVGASTLFPLMRVYLGTLALSPAGH